MLAMAASMKRNEFCHSVLNQQHNGPFFVKENNERPGLLL